MTKRTAIGLTYTIFSAIIIIGGTILAIRWANGDFRRDQNSGQMVSESGLLNTISSPTGAQVYIDDKLTSVTDNVLYLQPGTYNVSLHKDGYFGWKKTLQVERGLVTNTDARLFPSSPNLSSLTFNGVENLSVSPDGQKLVFFTASASASTQNGLYLLDMSTSGTQTPKNAKQIANYPDSSFNLSTADIIWSSDSSEFLLLTDRGTFLLPLGVLTNLSLATDVSWKANTLLSTWEEDMYLREREYLAKFPPEIIAIATQSAKNVYLSPDKKKIVYTATASAVLTENLIPPVPAASTQVQARQLIPGSIYVYDMYEDRNFKLSEENKNNVLNKDLVLGSDAFAKNPLTLVSSPSAFTRLQAENLALTANNFKSYYSPLYVDTWQWMSDSKHLVSVQNNQIVIIDYDATNPITIYSGPFLENFIYPWSDGSRLLMLTTFSPDYPPNIYSIELVK